MSAVFINACGDGSGPPDEPVAATLRLESGDDQLQVPGVGLPDPLVVQVFDEGGNPVSGATVAWSVQAGEGTVAPSTTTDNSGLASTTWTLGPEEGIQRVTVSCGSATPQSFQARAV
jgi:adhesin/invasin